MDNEQAVKAIFYMFLITMLLCSSTAFLMTFDFSGPILSERNPNGTIDVWYLGSGAFSN